jgi:hypothetical protein
MTGVNDVKMPLITCGSCVHGRQSEGKMARWINCSHEPSWVHRPPQVACRFVPSRYLKRLPNDSR